MGPPFMPNADAVEVKTESVPTNTFRRSKWSASRTTRLNEAHWAYASGENVNSALSTEWERITDRCMYEAGDNADVEGTIETHVTDVIGDTGPMLQVLTGNEEVDKVVENVWKGWFCKPDASGKLSGVDLLKTWWRTLWKRGELLAQWTMLTDAQTSGARKAGQRLRTRLRDLDPKRLASSPETAGQGEAIMGVHLDRDNRPTAYDIDQSDLRETSSLAGYPYKKVDAQNILHWFIQKEPEQVRGIPWLTSALQKIADSRDYDAETLDAARTAADHAAVIYTEDPTLTTKAEVIDESAPIERRQYTTLPPGYKMTPLNPAYPNTQYSSFSDSLKRSLGRAQNMPLMMINLDSRQHNYSSARFDSVVYNRSVQGFRRWMELGVLAEILEVILREAELMGLIPLLPDDTEFNWFWPGLPNVDPEKEAAAAETRLRIGISTYRDEIASTGRWYQDSFKQQSEERKMRETLDLPDPWEKNEGGAFDAEGKPAKSPADDARPRPGPGSKGNGNGRAAEAGHLHQGLSASR